MIERIVAPTLGRVVFYMPALSVLFGVCAFVSDVAALFCVLWAILPARSSERPFTTFEWCVGLGVGLGALAIVFGKIARSHTRSKAAMVGIVLGGYSAAAALAMVAIGLFLMATGPR